MDKSIYNASYSYNASQDILQVQSGKQVSSYAIDYDWYRDYWQPVRREYITSHTTLIKERDKFGMAYKIAKQVVAKRFVTSNKLRDFFNLVEVIAKEL